MSGPLQGLRVVDLSIDMAGPLAGMMLADAGADVIKVEPPGGDPTAPRPGFVAWNRGKRRRTCDLDRHDDREALRALLRSADVVLVGTAPGGLTYDQLDSVGLVGPDGVWVVVSPYLPSGTPWAGGQESPGLVFADMGHAWSQTSYENLPVDCVYPLALCLQGIWAAAVAVAAARSTRRDGRSRTVGVGAAHAAVMVSPGAFSRRADAVVSHPPGGPGGSLPNYRCYRCSDGEWLFLGAYTAAFIRRALGVLGLSQLLDDPRLAGDPSNVRRPENFQWIVDEFDRCFATQERSRWVELLQAADVPVAPALATADWLDHPQVVALGLRAEATDAVGRKVVMPGPPILFSATPAEVGTPAVNGVHVLSEVPPLGEAVPSWSSARAEAPASRPDEPAVRPGGPAAPGEGEPSASYLDDVRVIDMGTIIAGPYAATLLAELGAEVVKVERPPHGDEFRTATGGAGRGGFDSYNRNQLSMAVDLQSGPGRAALDALLDRTDVVVDNFRPGVLERLGMDWSSLAADRPGIVSVSISAFGGAGPLGPRPGFDPVVQALSGIMRTQGGENPADSPTFLTVPINDVIGAGLAAFGVCAALWHRDSTGLGQQINVALVASSCLLQLEQILEIDGVRVLAGGDRDFCGPTPLSRLYRAADGWARLDGNWPADVDRLRAAGLLAGPVDAGPADAGPADAGRVDAGSGGNGSTGHGSTGNESTGSGSADDESGVAEAESAAAVSAELEATIGGRAVAEVVERANAAGVPAVVVRTFADVGRDPRLRLDGVTTDGATETILMEPGRWYEVPGQPGRVATPAPGYGQHTSSLLQRLDLDGDEIVELFRSGSVAGT